MEFQLGERGIIYNLHVALLGNIFLRTLLVAKGDDLRACRRGGADHIVGLGHFQLVAGKEIKDLGRNIKGTELHGAELPVAPFNGTPDIIVGDKTVDIGDHGILQGLAGNPLIKFLAPAGIVLAMGNTANAQTQGQDENRQ